ncbi:MAG: glucose-6-phosphate isomerase, partial [Paracoccaceae bacterium]
AQTTLVNIASKTFTTTETMENAKTARAWLGRSLGDKAGGHMCAVSSAIDRAQAFGVPLDRVFGFGDFIGGRLSLWGPVGLPILLAIGPERFRSFLSGAQAMDLHFRETPFERNLPVLLALSGIWHRNFCGYHSRAILPYDQRLHLLPAYLQQLDMESNGKCVTLANTGVEHETGPVVWGQPGTNGQHAFFQLLHQGSDIVPAEFLIAARGFEPELGHHHDLLVANCLAQSEALMRGRSEAEARDLARREGLKGDALDMQARHRAFEGNRPSVAIAYPRLTPFVLGQIIALYEHRVFVEGAIWNINSFDQWGVELGKELAGEMLPLVKGGAATGKDASTRGLLSHLARGQREEPEKP